MKGSGLALTLGLLACSGAPAKPPVAAAKAEPPLNAQPWERDPFTRTSEVLIDGALVGYVVDYQPLPAGSLIERRLPTGTWLIQDLRFENVGFVSPRGDVRRYVKDGSTESLGVWRFEEGLRRFYDTPNRVVLRELAPAPPPKPELKDAGEAKPEAGKDGKDAGGKTPPKMKGG